MSTKAKILNAAEDLFSAASTIDNVTIEAIAIRAGVSRATIYRYFKDKQGLLSALSEAGFQVPNLGGENRRDQILEAALKLFGQQGFHATTLDQVAESAGVSKGAIYWHFKSKDDLVDAIVEHYSAIPDLARLMVTGADIDEHETLSLIASRLLETAQARIDVLRMAVCESQHFPVVRDLLFQKALGKLYTHLSQYLEGRIEAGVFRPCNPMLATQIFVSTLVMFALASHTLAEKFPFSREEMVQEFVHLFLDGMRKH